MKVNTSNRMKTIFNLAILACGLAVLPVQAQLAVPPPTTVYQPLSDQQLDQLLGPIALYPDPLMADILPAATLPTQIVMADRYVSGGGDPNEISQQPWDASVQAVAHYPNVLKYLDDNLNWTEELGQAFLNQQQDVMDSIQRLRSEAQSMGNLQSTPQEDVETDDGDIDIVPTDPDVIYVPVYEPDQIYYDNGIGISFGIGFPIGFWLNGDFDWHHHNLIVWDNDHPRPVGWWHEPPDRRNIVLASHTVVWHPASRPGFATANRGDRGWNNPVVRPAANRPVERPASPAPEISRPEVNRPEAAQVERPATFNRPAAALVERSEAASRPEASGAFIGAQSSRATQAFSERGQQSIEASRPEPAPRSEPVSRPAPEAAPASHSSNSSSGGGYQQRH
jgi:hypothetical protein